MNVYDAIQQKHAVRQFKDQPLTDHEIRRILHAGRRAQSSKNTQPWQFIAIRDKATLQKLADTRQNIRHVAGSALCVVILLPNQRQTVDWQMFDAGQSAAYMQLEATELGIASCLGAIHELDAVRDLLGFPNEWAAHALVSFGYPLDVTPRPLKAGGRRTLDDVVHWERW